ncbi:MAG TPA: hypothetical protein VI258_11015, partial [Rhodanobacteraceae bacterium]
MQVIVVADAVARPVNGGVSLEPLERRFYYPGTSSRERAEGLDVAVGEERTAIDFVLPGNVSGERFGMVAASGLGRNAVEKSPNATGIIRGRVVGIDGRPLTQA